jgi:prepilin-type N-terminal cleavage/methylation domain-containing protein
MVLCQNFTMRLLPQSVTRRNGFTLIELSIVLVIVGLIVGGVLVGQDLIRSAAVRAQISTAPPCHFSP